MADKFIWRPSAELVERANVTRLARTLGAGDYHALHRISVEEPERFWPAVVADLGIEFSRPWDAVVDASRGPEWATWFTGGHLNAARVCLHRWAAARPDEEALVGRYEDGRRESLTFAEASHQATQLAEALVELGVREGDRVAIFMPMCPAVAVASHACAHIGAVQVPIFSGFAAPAIASRLEDSGAKVVLCADWSLRRGKRIEMRETLEEAGRFAVEHVVAWNRETCAWPEVVTRQPGVLPPAEIDSEAPYLLAYTSGTTGKPKGALHVQGGFLVSIAREVAYQADVNAGDRIHFATDMGWIMGPWTVLGGGAVGATIVLAEGAPDWPDDRLWQLVESERMTMLGLSPTLVRALIPKGEPTADLSSLRTLVTTGEPWNPDP
ncbi:MAG TPA: AMP-binding protein, partial [Gaiellaceae bacterium]|nr:AMP-binding protein [Gaiellaceae bacterium]